MAAQAAAAAAAATTEGEITATGTVAVLPPCLLWLASVTASSDTDKGILTAIDVRRTASGSIRITSTDGHRCTRVVIPQSDNFFVSQDQLAPFRLNAAAFFKLPSKKRALCFVNSDGLARITDPAGKLIEAFEWGSETHAGLAFPQIDQLWPDDHQLTCNPGESVAFNGRFMAECCNAATRLGFSNNVVQMFTTNQNLAPVIVRWKLDLSWLMYKNISDDRQYVSYAEDDITVETLIMPIQIRK